MNLWSTTIGGGAGWLVGDPHHGVAKLLVP